MNLIDMVHKPFLSVNSASRHIQLFDLSKVKRKLTAFHCETFLHIKVITEDEETAEKLYNYMQVSTIADDFFIERFRISISEPKQNIVIPAYNGDFKIKTMEIVN